MGNVHYNVAPRYTAGSPAMVSREIAEQVAREEREAYQWHLDGVMGRENKERAQRMGLQGIVEARQEIGRGWRVWDMITGERFERPFNHRTERAKVRGERKIVNRALLEEAAAIISSLIEGCDHSVGICFCEERRVIEALQEAAK